MSNQQTEQAKLAAQNEPVHKKVYHTPEFKCFGSIAELTEASINQGSGDGATTPNYAS